MRLMLYVLLVVATGLTAQVIASQAPQAPTPTPSRVSAAITPLIAGGYLVAAPGRIEPGSEEITIGVSVTGLLREVAVGEGDSVARGQILAVIESEEYKAALARADAELRLRETELLRLNNGARPQERRQAMAAVQEAEAVVKNSADTVERRRVLAANGYTSQEVLERAQREHAVARQRLEAAKQKYALVDDRARDEDITIAEARVAVARALREEAQAQLDKTVVRSPINGTVLRVIRHPGELVSTFLDTPVLVVGDLSRLNARVDVDEADVGKIAVGMPAYVTAEAFGDRRFAGHVVRVGRMVGNKNIRTDEPKERADAKVLEVLIAIDDPQTLPPGLRVNAFMTAPESAVLRLSTSPTRQTAED